MIHAVIPTRYRPPQLGLLLNVLAFDRVATHVMDSDLFAHRVYAMWNAGALVARMEGADWIAVLNDDVTLVPGTLPLMAEALRSDPTVGVVYPDCAAPMAGLPASIDLERTAGTWGAGGLTGFCFMFRADAPLPVFDEGYHLWYGDDAFEEGVRAAGYGVARVRGLPVVHEPMGSTARDMDYWGPRIEQDRARWDVMHAQVPA